MRAPFKIEQNNLFEKVINKNRLFCFGTKQSIGLGVLARSLDRKQFKFARPQPSLFSTVRCTHCPVSSAVRFAIQIRKVTIGTFQVEIELRFVVDLRT